MQFSNQFKKKMIVLGAVAAGFAVLFLGIYLVFFQFDLRFGTQSAGFQEPETQASSQMTEEVRTELVEQLWPPVPVQAGQMKDMKAVVLQPGVDVFPYANMLADEVQVQVEAFVYYLAENGFNTVIVDTRLNQFAVFQSPVLQSTSVDLMKLVMDEAKPFQIKVYAIYHMDRITDRQGVLIDTLPPEQKQEKLLGGLEDLVRTYDVDGILLDDFEREQDHAGYEEYRRYAGGMDYSRWLLESARADVTALKAVANGVKDDLPVGILVDQEEPPAVSDGRVPSNLTENIAKMVETRTVDFINVAISQTTEDPEQPFAETAKRWGDLCTAAELPFYVTHDASKAGGTQAGWEKPDQLAKQVALLKAISSCGGSAFSGYGSLSQDNAGSTGILLKYYSGFYSVEDLAQGVTVQPVLPERENGDKKPSVLDQIKGFFYNGIGGLFG